MEIRNTTKYSLDALLEFNKHHIKRRKGFWIFFGIVTLIAFLSFALCCFTYFTSGEPFDWYIAYMFGVVLIVDLFYVLYFTVFMKLQLKKTPTLDADAEYLFTEDEIKETFVSASLNQTLNCKYDSVVLVSESENYLYIYIAKNQAYVVDKDGFTEGTLYDLKVLLSQKIDAKKIKYSVGIY